MFFNDNNSEINLNVCHFIKYNQLHRALYYRNHKLLHEFIKILYVIMYILPANVPDL
jgi:hypothetical protein